MVNFMIAVDEGENSEHCIREVVQHIYNREKDVIYLISVAQDPITFPSSAMSAVLIAESLKAVERQHKSILINRTKFARSLGTVNVHALLGHGNHVGEAVCKAAEQKNIEYLVVGRRGMGAIKRIFIGSTSRYILEHAPCNVICVKDHSESGEKEKDTNTEQQQQQQHDHSEIDSFNDFEKLHLHV
ncbi:hypothetical protein CYY_000918 [Polysphondylium violaceum]|uniref:UspA domain-containing protein n=1 Tax=Polysphondylium violaceum TaxID=133409 RepID=A0A8J4Q2X8_9MYCE|nr:hypothetical protein CYY_000918 [Polysphondylium violaceum]